MRAVFDLVILVFASCRLTRLITHDDLGLWLLREPLYRWARFDPANGAEPGGLKSKLVSGLTCPFCVGFWAGLPLLASLVLAGGPGRATPLWEVAAGAFALNYLCGHVSRLLDGPAE
jgi:hypothetical protein